MGRNLRALAALLSLILIVTLVGRSDAWRLAVQATSDETEETSEDSGEADADEGDEDEDSDEEDTDEGDGEEDSDEEDDDDAYTRELEEQRQNTLNAIDSIKSDISTVEEKISALQSSKSSLQTYINQLDAELNALSEQITELEESIARKEEEIESSEEELAQTEEEAEGQYAMMKKRIQYMYENGTESFLELLLESEDVADLLNRAEYSSQMAEYDRSMMQELQETLAKIEEQKAALEEEKAELEELLSETESQQKAVNTAIEAKSQEIASYQAQINAASGEQSTYEDQLDEQEKLLDQVEQQIAAAAAAKASADDGDGGSSTGFLWPCPSSHRITSSFGYRTAPVAGASTYHKGIDIGASSGAAIVASASGRVTTATYSSSAGNYVVISHGNGISTVYMHASALYVSEGDIVTQGQTIAAVGSTGYSTGPHLHFGVIVNGSYVDPTGYVN